MYGREMRTKRPDLCRELTVLDEATRDKDWANKLKGKASLIVNAALKNRLSKLAIKCLLEHRI